jgi:predicted nucleotidyltransferase
LPTKSAYGKANWGGRALRDWIADLVELIVDRFDPVRVFVFGSVAAGTDGPDSDLDLLVVLDDAPAERRRSLLVELRKATRAFRVPRDLLVTCVEDCERERVVVGTVERAAFEARLVAYERRHAA